MAYILKLLESISPTHGSKDVYLDKEIIIKFNTVMMHNTINRDTVHLHLADGSKTPVEFNWHYNKAGRTVTIKPTQSLKPHTEYAITFEGGKTGVRNIRGDFLYSDTLIAFTTGESYQHTPPQETSLEEEPEETANEETSIENTSQDSSPGESQSRPSEGAGSTPLADTSQAQPGSQVSFSLISSYPANNELWNTSNPIALKFSKPVSISNQEEISFYIKPISELMDNYVTIPFRLSLSQNETTLYLTPNEPPLKGEEYRILIKEGFKAKDGETLSSSIAIDILSEFEFSYLDVETLKLVGGDFARDYTDIELAKLIGNASSNLYNTLLSIEKIQGDGYTIVTGVESPYGANQYILYSVLYQMILGSSLTTASGQAKNIRLGDLSVEQSTTVSSSLPDLLDMLKSEMDRWWAILINKDPLADNEDETYTNWHRDVTSAVRGAQDYPYPEFQTRVPFNDLGGNV